EPFSCQTGARDRRPAPERLELGIVDDAGVRIDLDLQPHHIATFWCADEAGPHVGIVLWQRPDVARIFIVIDDLGRISHACRSSNARLTRTNGLPTASSIDRRLLLPTRTTATSHGVVSRPE